VRRKNVFIVAVLVATLALGGCFGKKKQKQPDVGASAEPDKVLYERALDDIKHGRHAVGRLTLQTLINTYPDSEYLAKAKLAIADSYYKEGGRAGLAQAIAEYKDFETFFPFLSEAPYAQMQVAMAHYRQMEKPDRDRTEAVMAEEELQIFLQKFPDDKLVPNAEQRLREVQEVLAEGDYRIAHFYAVKGSNRAAVARLAELTSRYPLYSQADKALWMLANIFEKAEKSDLATQFYARIVREYPLSDLANDAKGKLTKLGVPVPQPDPVALARMQKEREADRERPGMFRRSFGLLKTSPDVSMAAHSGQPNLTPPSETTSATEILTPTSSKPTVGAGGGTSGTGVVVETVPPGSPGSSAPPATASPSTAPSASSPGNTPPAESASNTPASPPGASPAPNADPSAPAAKPDDGKGSDKGKKDDKADKKKESTSKKKKGLRKIIPW